MSAKKQYHVLLTKSYVVKIQAKSRSEASHIAEFYTGDSEDFSTARDREEHDFLIEEMECTVNEAFDAYEVAGG